MPLSLNLRQRFSLTVLAAIALASCVMMVTIYWAVSNYTREYTVHYWQEYTQTFANSAKFSVTLASPDKAIEIASYFKKEQVVEKASIYASSGQPLASTGNTVKCAANRLDEPFDLARFRNTFVFEFDEAWCFYVPIYYSPEAFNYIESEQTANPSSSLIGFVELVVSKNALKAVIQKILWLSIVSVIVFELVIFVSVQHFSDVLTRALLELSRVMQQTSMGQRGLRATFEGPPDIVALKQRLNQMLDQIEAQEEELEEKVATRTSELQTALDSALSASRYKSKIMSMVSHEMKSPLHSIMGYTQLATEALNPASEPNVKHFLDNSLECANNLENQINQILDYARLESGKSQVHLSNFNIRNLVTQCHDKIAPLCEHSGNRILMDGDNDDIETDQDKLMHILLNLMGNANKFTRNGHIDITWSIRQSQLIIQVSDTGCGISATDQAKIFDPFWQADMSLSRPAGGTGLGLAIVKLYTELLSGEITVESSDRGSIFSVTLPIARA